VKPSSLVPARTGGNPRLSPGSSVVVVAPLFGGVAWYAELQSARSVVGILRRAQRLRGIFVFVDPTFSTLISLFFSFMFFRCVCANTLTIILGRCYINIVVLFRKEDTI
jgi:hypothetical protein